MNLNNKDKFENIVESLLPISMSTIAFIVIIIKFKNFNSSRNFNDALTASITIISIFIGVYSTIMPVVFAMKYKNKLFKDILENKKYKKYLFIATANGFICICFSFCLYFIDIINNKYAILIISCMWAFFLLYFLFSNIRVVIITVLMLMSNKEESKEKIEAECNKKVEENKREARKYFDGDIKK